MTEVRGGLVEITRNMSSKSYPSFIPIFGYMVSSVPPADQDSTPWRLVLIRRCFQRASQVFIHILTVPLKELIGSTAGGAAR